jgi:hypothetical protein
MSSVLKFSGPRRGFPSPSSSMLQLRSAVKICVAELGHSIAHLWGDKMWRLIERFLPFVNLMERWSCWHCFVGKVFGGSYRWGVKREEKSAATPFSRHLGAWLVQSPTTVQNFHGSQRTVASNQPVHEN